MTDIVHRIGIKAPAADVYAALCTIEGLAGWWTEQATGASKAGDVASFRFYLETGELLGGFDMDVMELSPMKHRPSLRSARHRHRGSRSDRGLQCLIHLLRG